LLFITRAPRTKVALQRQLPDPGVERFHVNRRLCGLKFRLAAENPGGTFKKLRSPDRDVVGMNVKLSGQRLLALEDGQRHLRPKDRAVVPAGSFANAHSCPRPYAAFRQIPHSSKLSRIPDPPHFDVGAGNVSSKMELLQINSKQR
jgi:hypothetical protein